MFGAPLIHDDNDSIRINSLTHLLEGIARHGKRNARSGARRTSSEPAQCLGAGCRPAHLRRCTIRARPTTHVTRWRAPTRRPGAASLRDTARSDGEPVRPAPAPSASCTLHAPAPSRSPHALPARPCNGMSVWKHARTRQRPFINARACPARALCLLLIDAPGTHMPDHASGAERRTGRAIQRGNPASALPGYAPRGESRQTKFCSWLESPCPVHCADCG